MMAVVAVALATKAWMVVLVLLLATKAWVAGLMVVKMQLVVMDLPVGLLVGLLVGPVCQCVGSIGLARPHNPHTFLDGVRKLMARLPAKPWGFTTLDAMARLLFMHRRI